MENDFIEVQRLEKLIEEQEKLVSDKEDENLLFWKVVAGGVLLVR